MIRLLMTMMMAAVTLGSQAAPSKPLRKGPLRVQTQTAKKQTPAKKPAKTTPSAANVPIQTQYRRLPYVGAIAADADTGKVFFSDNADRKAYPASVTKLMTALLVLEDVEKGKYKLTDRATASVRATFEQPSGVGIRPKESMTIDDLLMALMVRSANDAAVVLAENAAGGDLLAFIARMNARAQQIGMANTKYDSPNGLPPYDAKRRPKRWRHGYDSSTAADVLKLSREIVKHPQIFKYTSTKIAVVTDGAGKPLRSVNHNNILVKDKQKILNADGVSEVDGLKTGYIDAGGSSISLTAKRNGKRAIVVVLGSASTKERDAHARAIMVSTLDKLCGKSTPGATAAVAPTPVPAAPAAAPAEKPVADPAPRTAVAEPAAPAVAVAPSQPDGPRAQKTENSSGGGLGFGVGLLMGAAAVAAVAFAAWRWLGQDDRERWDFQDLPADKGIPPTGA